MPPITVRSSRLKYALLLAIALAFVTLGIFILIKGKSGQAWIGWMNILFFGAGAFIFSRQFFDSRPRLLINDEGILDRTLGVGLIPWPEITGAYLKSIQGNDFICLEVRNPERWTGQLSPVKRAMTSANEALGFTALNLNLSAVDADPSQVLELILKSIAQKQSVHHSISRPA